MSEVARTETETGMTVEMWTDTGMIEGKSKWKLFSIRQRKMGTYIVQQLATGVAFAKKNRVARI